MILTTEGQRNTPVTLEIGVCGPRRRERGPPAATDMKLRKLVQRACKPVRAVLFPKNSLGHRGEGVVNAARVIIISIYIAIGVVMFVTFESKPCASTNATRAACTEPLSVADGLYVAVVTISTVGYGDIHPTGSGMRIFSMLYILFGSGYVFVLLSRLFAGVLERFRASALNFIDKYDRSATTVSDDTDGDGRQDTQRRVAGRSKGLSGRGVDLSGDGQVDFIEPPGPFVFWAQELLPASILWLVMQLGSAGVFTAAQPGLDYFTAFCACMRLSTSTRPQSCMHRMLLFFTSLACAARS